MLPWEVYILFVSVAKDLDELYFLLDMAFNLVVLKDPHILFSFFWSHAYCPLFCGIYANNATIVSIFLKKL